ncbi:MAG: hypothetical protein L0Y79_07115 [Chlorobi bacterium]|nr:hypothetical protein [Chlorobiota bacterium]MCI0715238.1 hypothetical protein [Chlorobiota bacterium]
MILPYLENIELSLKIDKKQGIDEQSFQETDKTNEPVDADSENYGIENKQNKDNNRTAWENLAKSL